MWITLKLNCINIAVQISVTANSYHLIIKEKSETSKISTLPKSKFKIW